MELFYAFTDIYGGFSSHPYKSLNPASHVGDELKNVEKNRQYLQKKYSLKKLVFMEQVHGVEAKILTNPNEVYKCDALITDKPNLALCVLVADCIPLLLFDAKNGIIATIHAGRAGVFGKIAQKTLDKMQQNFGTKPQNVVAFMGASIGQCCYEVSGEVLAYSQKHYPDFVMHKHLDIRGILKKELSELGVFVSEDTRCTSCDKSLFSYRRDGITGRNVGIIALRSFHA